MLNRLYGEFDALADAHGVYKIETIGDGCPPCPPATLQANFHHLHVCTRSRPSATVGALGCRYFTACFADFTPHLNACTRPSPSATAAPLSPAPQLYRPIYTTCTRVQGRDRRRRRVRWSRLACCRPSVVEMRPRGCSKSAISQGFSAPRPVKLSAASSPPLALPCSPGPQSAALFR